jgi:predicted molibdopterin-dependent oxidoreductase YjgC
MSSLWWGRSLSTGMTQARNHATQLRSTAVQELVEFTLDGRPADAPEGELLVHAAARHGVFIPTLCHDDKLDPYGGCRLCVVSVEGAPRPLPACATRVSAGMVVSTNGSTDTYRRTLTEMLLSEHLNDSPGGRPNELVSLAEELGATAPLVLPDARRKPYEDRNRLMGYDPDACILCNRCVRYTQEVMQCSALSLEGRGGEARIVPTWERSWLDTECELCGGCLSVCPTGAIFEKFLEGAPVGHERRLEKVKTTCTFCGVGCQVDLNVDPETKRIVKVTSNPDYVSNEGNLCVKGRFAFNFVHHPDRLTEPLVRGDDGELQATTWEHALATAAKGLKEVKDRHGPQSIGVLASARLTMEENFLIQKLARTAIGTNSVHSCEAT